MKYIGLIFFFGIFNFSYSQTFIPMLDTENSWSIDFISEPIGGGSQSTYTLQVSLTGTETYNGFDYFLVSNQNGETGCLLREENGILYRYNVDDDEESVMYDFNLTVGDVFNFDEMAIFGSYCSIGSNNNYAQSREVTEVDIQFLANENRKIIFFENIEGLEEIWIEGIGSVNGFDPISATLDIHDETNLVCFTRNGVTTYFNNASSCNNTNLGVEDFTNKKSILYPNPVKDISILQMGPSVQATNIKIYNCNGNIVSEKTIETSAITINAMEFASGLYFYSIYKNNKVISTDKFIIQ